MISYNFYVDWDCTNWSDAPDFSQPDDDITSYVKKYSIERGKNQELGNALAGTLDLTLNNTSRDFTPTNVIGKFYSTIRLWLPILMTATIGEDEPQIFYLGFISEIKIDPHPQAVEAYFYCTDGMDLLARQLITQDPDNLQAMSDGTAINQILDAAGWSADNRNIDMDGGDTLLEYPTTYPY